MQANEITTGRDLRTWREAHRLPRTVLAQAVGYASQNTITMIELYRGRVPQRVRDYVAQYTPPPPLSGAALRAWRQRHGLTTEALARWVGRTASAVRMWELGYRRVPWRVRVLVTGHTRPDAPLPAPRPTAALAVLAAVESGLTTAWDIWAALTPRMSREQVRQHLRTWERAGRIVRRTRQHGECVWTPIDGSRAGATGGGRMMLYAAYGSDGRFVVHRLDPALAFPASDYALCGFRARLGWFDVRETPIPGQRPCAACTRLMEAPGPRAGER